MNLRVLCPEGHPVCIAVAKLGGVVFCPQCYTSFQAELADPTIRSARNDGPKPKRARDEDDEEEEKPVRKKTGKKDDDEEEDEKPRKKPAKAKKTDDDDEDDEEEDADAPEEEDETIDWTKKKRQLAIVNTGLMAYLVSYYMMMLLYVIMVLCAVPWLILLVFAYFVFAPLPSGKYDTSLADFFLFLICCAAGVGAGPIYICQIVGWFTGLFAPAKAEARSVCIAALLMVLGPILLYLIYAIFRYGGIIQEDRLEVSEKMLNMFNGFAFVSVMMAFYTGLLYLGRIAGYMGMTMDKHKPAALGWFIVGGSILLAACIVILMFVPWWGVLIVAGFTYNVFYFVITSIRELIEVVQNVRKQIDEHIKYG